MSSTRRREPPRSDDRYVSNDLHVSAWAALAQLQRDAGRHLPKDPIRSALVKALTKVGAAHMDELVAALQEETR